MADKSEHHYPDTCDIFQRKAEGRKKLAALSFGEKIARLEALRVRLEPFHQAPEKRRAEKETGKRDDGAGLEHRSPIDNPGSEPPVGEEDGDQ